MPLEYFKWPKLSQLPPRPFGIMLVASFKDGIKIMVSEPLPHHSVVSGASTPIKYLAIPAWCATAHSDFFIRMK